MEHPEIFYPAGKYEEKIHTLQPVYGLTAGLSNNVVAKAMHQALSQLDLTRETLPDELRLKYGLAEYNYVIRGIHFPEDKEVFYHARERLVFEEFLEFILSIRKMKDKNERIENEYIVQRKPEVDELIGRLPYELTKAQKKVWDEIAHDMAIRYRHVKAGTRRCRIREDDRGGTGSYQRCAKWISGSHDGADGSPGTAAL